MVQNLKEMLACKEQVCKRFPLDIQLFGNDPQDPPADPVDPPAEPPLNPAEPPQPPKTLTQEDINAAIADARKEWEKEQQLQQTEAQKLAKMTADEKKAYEEKKRLEGLEKREAEITKRELMSTAKETLISKNLPIELAAVLDYTDADACNASIDKIGKAFQDAVQAGIASRIAGTDPIKKSKLGDTPTLTKEDVAKMTPQQINDNWDEIQSMMKNGQLN